MNNAYQLDLSQPSAEDFAALRALVGWNNPDITVVQSSMEHTLFWTNFRFENQLVATGRIVGDGAMYFYIQDVIVHPKYQGQGLGHRIMEHIEAYLSQHCVKGSTVGLLSAFGKETFYQKYGYTKRDGNPLGLGMCKFI